MRKHTYNPLHLFGIKSQVKISKMPKVLYINRAVRSDRRFSMEKQLKESGFQFERIDAPTPDRAIGFLNRATRGAFLSHLELIERIARETREYIILEDDVSIRDRQRMALAIARIRREEWACLYFYGASSLRRIYGIVDVHAYLINPQWASNIAGALRERYNALSLSGPKDSSTCIDQYIAHHLQHLLPYWGMSACVIQNRKKFGSDTGWMGNKREE